MLGMHFHRLLWMLRFMDNSPTNQLADNEVADRPIRRQFNSPKLIYGRFSTRRNAVESMKVALPAV